MLSRDGLWTARGGTDEDRQRRDGNSFAYIRTRQILGRFRYWEDLDIEDFRYWGESKNKAILTNGLIFWKTRDSGAAPGFTGG